MPALTKVGVENFKIFNKTLDFDVTSTVIIISRGDDMEYSTHELSKLSGVTARTLRWYDKIGLLSPSRVSESGYRYYGKEEVNRLQEILFYRELGFELNDIKKQLDDKNYDRISALRSHLEGLSKEKKRIDRLIDAVESAIKAEERNEIMSDKKKFEAFKKNMVEENEKKYGKEVREKYGDKAADEANAAVMGLSEELYKEWKSIGEEINERLEDAVKKGLSPEGEEAKEIVYLHRRWLSFTSKYDVNKHRGIAEMYVLDERFTAYYDKNVPGCAKFLRDAVIYWVK